MGDTRTAPLGMRALPPRRPLPRTPSSEALRDSYPTTYNALLAAGWSEESLYRATICSAISAQAFNENSITRNRSTLRDLVTEWTKQKLPGNLSRQYYIDILQDTRLRITTFKFLELPPELRNNIYIELLTLRDRADDRGTPQTGMSCFPKILQTNKQISKEAASILYGENIPEVTFARPALPIHTGHPTDPRTITISYEKARHVSRTFPPSRAPQTRQRSWSPSPPRPYILRPRQHPTPLLPRDACALGLSKRPHMYERPSWTLRLGRFKSINVTIFFGQAENRVEFSRDLYVFVTGMVASKTLKSINFNMAHVAADYGTTRIEQVLWPVAFLAHKVNFVLKGIPDELMASMKPKIALLETLSHEHDLLSRAYDLYQRGAIIEQLWTELGHDARCIYPHSGANPVKLQHSLNDIAGLLSSKTLIDPLRHAMFVQNVSVLDAFLQGTEAAQIRTAALAKANKMNKLLAM